MRENVLIVDDEGIVAMDLRNRLSAAGYTIVGTAFTGQDAIGIVSLKHPDIVLLDIGLKGDMDGITTGGIIRGEYNIPVIYVTAYSDINTLQRAKVTEPYGYILKPFEERDLKTTIEMAISKFNIDRKLNEARQLLATTLNSIGDAVITTDTDTRIVFMNPVAEALTGWTLAEVSGRLISDVFNLVSPDGKSPQFSPIERVLKEGVVTGLADQTMLVRKDGTRIPIDDSAAPIKDDKGRIAGVVLVFRDFTEKRKAEEALRESERKLRLIIETSPLPMAIYDLTGKGEFVNKKFTDLFGYDLNDGRTIDEWWVRIYPDEAYRQQIREEWYGNIRKAMTNGTEIPSQEARITCKDGTTCDVICSVSSIGDRNLVMWQDITGLKRAEIALRDSEAYFRALAESTPAVITIIKNDRFVYANRALTSLTGYSPDDVKAMAKWWEILSPDMLDFVRARSLARKEGKSVPSRYEIKILDKNGRSMWMDLTIAPIMHDGEPAILSTAIDISERKAAEEALQQERELLVEGPNVAFKWRAGEGWPVEYVTPNVTTYFGYDPVDFTGGKISYASIIHPDDLQRVAAEIARYNNNVAVRFEQEYRIRHADGRFLWIYDFTRVIRDRQNVVTHYHGYIRDIGARKAMEEKLFQTNQLYKTVVDSSPFAILTIDPEGFVTSWNSFAERLFGWTPGEVIGRFNPTIPEEKKAEFRTNLNKVIQGLGYNNNATLRLRKDGSYVNVTINASPLKDITGNIVGAVIIVKDNNG